VTGRVEERDLAAVVLGLVRADVLRDPARLRLDDGRLADRIQQRRLAVVDVAHDRDDRRPRREICLVVLEDLRLFVLVGGVADRQLALRGELGGDQLDLVVTQRLRDGHGLAEAHHEHDDLRRRHAERLGEVANGEAGLDRDWACDRRDLAGLLRARGLAFPLLLARIARPGSGVVDHDAPLAARAGASLTGPHGPVRPV
jgi:hypothetical protein